MLSEEAADPRLQHIPNRVITKRIQVKENVTDRVEKDYYGKDILASWSKIERLDKLARKKLKAKNLGTRRKKGNFK